MIIDNASFDGSAELVEAFLKSNPELANRSRLVKNRTNLGFTRAHNQALTWTAGEFVMILNQDVILSPGYIGELLDCLKRDERSAAVSGRLLQWRFDPATFYLGAEAEGAQIIDSGGLKLARSRRVTNLFQGESATRTTEVASRIFGVSATAALYRRSALELVSPPDKVFDEDFVSYKEDVDLAWRLQAAGFDALVLPHANAYHDRSLGNSVGFLGELRSRRQRHREHKVNSYANHLCLLIKNETLSNFSRDFPWIISHELVKFGYLLITDPGTLILGLGRAIRLLPTMIKKRRLLTHTRRRSTADIRQWWTRVNK